MIYNFLSNDSTDRVQVKGVGLYAEIISLLVS